MEEGVSMLLRRANIKLWAAACSPPKRAWPCLAAACDCSNRQCPAFMRRGSVLERMHSWLALADLRLGQAAAMMPGRANTCCKRVLALPPLRCRLSHRGCLPPATDERALTGQMSARLERARRISARRSGWPGEMVRPGRCVQGAVTRRRVRSLCRRSGVGGGDEVGRRVGEGSLRAVKTGWRATKREVEVAEGLN